MSIVDSGTRSSDDQSRFVMPVSDDGLACYVVGRASHSTRRGRLVGVVGSELEAQRFLDGAIDIRFVKGV